MLRCFPCWLVSLAALLAPCVLLALVVHERWGMMELMWTFSIYLESVAILPQLVLLQRVQNVDNLSGNYIFLLGSYLLNNYLPSTSYLPTSYLVPS